MSDNGSGARRPPPPPGGQRSVAKPPPPPVRKNPTPNPLVAQPAESASGLFHLEETKKTFKELVGEEFFSNFKRSLNIVCASCGFTIQKDFATRKNALIFRNETVAVFENGVMVIPLEKLGNEVEVYGRMFPSIKPGEIAAPSFAGLSSIPHGMFLSISSSGVELRFRAAVEIPAPAPAPEQKMLLEACKLLTKMGGADHAIPNAISVQGNSIFFRNGVDLAELAKIPESGGEARIYLKDISWGAPQCKLLLERCGASISEDRLAFIFMHTHVYLRIREDGFALCASNRRESEPLIYMPFQIE